MRQNLPDGSYTMDHSATLYLLDTRGRLVAVFSPPFSAAELRRRSAARRRGRARCSRGSSMSRLFVTLQYLLPHHLLCRMVYALTRARIALAQERADRAPSCAPTGRT